MLDPTAKIFLAALIVFAAYFLKGFSGFGPAIVMVPFFTLLYEPGTAITITTLFDFLAGLLLIWSVRRDLHWSFILSVFIALGLGAFLGAYLLGRMPVLWLKRCMGAVIVLFSILIITQGADRMQSLNSWIRFLRLPVGFFSGFIGGLLGISGPPLVIYMKILYAKTFFRSQLIAIFLLGTAWRSLLYYWNSIPMRLSLPEILIFVGILCLGLWAGNRIHLKVNEIQFNRIVAVIILFPAFNLLIT